MGLVENMAHFDVPGTGERYYPFGRGSAEVCCDSTLGLHCFPNYLSRLLHIFLSGQAIVKKFEDIKESSVFTMYVHPFMFNVALIPSDVSPKPAVFDGKKSCAYVEGRFGKAFQLPERMELRRLWLILQSERKTLGLLQSILLRLWCVIFFHYPPLVLCGCRC